MSQRKNSDDKSNPALPIGGLLDGVANILGRLGELAEKGEALRREGSFDSADGKSIQGSYGFTVKVGGDGKSSSKNTVVTPHTVAKSQAQPRPEASQPVTREPHVDIFEEADHIIVIAEMPGVPADQVTLRFEDRTLSLTGQAARLRFQTVIQLPCVCSPEDVSVTANNGVVELRLNLVR